MRSVLRGFSQWLGRRHSTSTLEQHMRLDLTFRNIQATDALRSRAEKKFLKVAKHMREPIEAHMVLRVEKHRHMAEMTVTGAGDQHFKVQESTDDMYSTIDGIMNKLERSARRARERLIDRAQGGATSMEGFAEE